MNRVYNYFVNRGRQIKPIFILLAIHPAQYQGAPPFVLRYTRARNSTSQSGGLQVTLAGAWWRSWKGKGISFIIIRR
jgi:hypothetical protein